MSNNFDNLSDDFLNEGDNNKGETNKPKDEPTNNNPNFEAIFDLENLSDDLSPEILDIIKAISDIKETNIDISDKLNLGEPDEHETTDEDGNTIDRSVWYTDFGSVTRISSMDEFPEMDPELFIDFLGNKFGGTPINQNITLEEKLKIAEDKEDYLECARLRDEILKKK